MTDFGLPHRAKPGGASGPSKSGEVSYVVPAWDTGGKRMDDVVVEFRQSGHYWSDLGLMALWRWLRGASPTAPVRMDEYYSATFGHVECRLHPNRVEVSGSRSQVYEVLRQAVDALRDQVWRPTPSGKTWWTPLARFLYPGQTELDFLLPYDELVKRGQWRRKGRCAVCDDCERPVRSAGTVHNPLIVNADKMSSFYSQLKGGYRICQSCAYATPFALTQVWYSWGDRFLSLTLLWPTGPDLLAVDRFLQQTSSLHVGENAIRNYQQAYSYADGPTACFLDLVCSLWQVSRTHLSVDALEMALSGIQFHAMQLSKPTKTSNVIGVDRYQTIPDPAGILRLVSVSDQSSTQGKVWNVLLSVLGDMPVMRELGGGIRADTGLLNQVADAIVARAPIEEALEKRVYMAIEQLAQQPELVSRFSTMAFRLLVPIYMREVMDVTADLLPALRSVGETLGEVVKEADDRSILYNLRNARNEDDLLDLLARVIVRHADAFVEGKPELWRNNVGQLAESLDGANWRRARSLLALYAGLKFIELSRRGLGRK